MPTATWISLLLVLAVGQGLFLATSLLLAPDRALRLPNRLLAALLVVLAAIIGHAWLGVNARFRDFPHLASAIATLPLLIGPLLWLYLRSLLQGATVSSQSTVHLLPFALALLAWAPYYFQPPEWKLALQAARNHLPWYLAAFGALKALHLAGYLLACYQLIRRSTQAEPTQGLVRSLHRLTLWLGAGLAIDAALFAADVLEWPTPVSSDLWGAVVLIGFVYGLAFYAMRVPLGYQPPLPQPAMVSAPAQSLLSPPERTQFLQKLTDSMEQAQKFRDGALTLEQLAQYLALTPHELSQLINQSFQMNLQEFLNGYRVAALQQALRDDANAESTVLDLALAAGFNSKSSLNRVFKAHTGMTPTQFRDTVSAPKSDELRSPPPNTPTYYGPNHDLGR